jgi:hypothetical protein
MLAVLSMVTLLQAPALGATCAAAPWHLGYDNMPPADSAPKNSIVNIWVARRDQTPIAWLYKTAAGAYYIQLTSHMGAAEAHKIGIARRFTANPFGRSEYGPQPVTSSELVSVETALMGYGASFMGCFSHDLPWPPKR